MLGLEVGWVGTRFSDWEKAGNSLLSQTPLGSLPCFRGHSLIQAGQVRELGLSPGSGEEGCRASIALWSLRRCQRSQMCPRLAEAGAGPDCMEKG